MDSYILRYIQYIIRRSFIIKIMLHDKLCVHNFLFNAFTLSTDTTAWAEHYIDIAASLIANNRA